MESADGALDGDSAAEPSIVVFTMLAVGKKQMAPTVLSARPAFRWVVVSDGTTWDAACSDRHSRGFAIWAVVDRIPLLQSLSCRYRCGRV